MRYSKFFLISVCEHRYYLKMLQNKKNLKLCHLHCKTLRKIQHNTRAVENVYEFTMLTKESTGHSIFLMFYDKVKFGKCHFGAFLKAEIVRNKCFHIKYSLSDL